MSILNDGPDGPAPFDFLTVAPPPPLDRYVESIWYAKGTVPYRRERIAPTGSTVAVIIFGDPIRQIPDDGEGEELTTDVGFLIGPHTRPTINEPLGETFAAGIVTTPVGCEAVFGVSPASIRGDVVLLSAAWSAAAVVRRELHAVLDRQPGDSGVLLDHLAGMLIAELNESVPGVDRCRAAVAALDAEPTRPIADIADELAVSHGHLDREFTRVVGLSPKALSGLLRVRRLLQLLDVNSEIGWSEHAAELGWFDQAHLIRDFKRHTGVTPSQYVDAQRANYTTVEPGDAAGFVPEA